MNIGNPQCVALGPLPDDERFRRLGPALERHEIFPAGTNVEFADVEAPDRVRILIWERGVGPTTSSGTGSCASLIAAAAFGGAARDAEVIAPGGTQRVEWREDSVYLTGWAEVLFDGEWLRDVTDCGLRIADSNRRIDLRSALRIRDRSAIRNPDPQFDATPDAWQFCVPVQRTAMQFLRPRSTAGGGCRWSARRRDRALCLAGASLRCATGRSRGDVVALRSALCALLAQPSRHRQSACRAAARSFADARAVSAVLSLARDSCKAASASASARSASTRAAAFSSAACLAAVCARSRRRARR